LAQVSPEQLQLSRGEIRRRREERARRNEQARLPVAPVAGPRAAQCVIPEEELDDDEEVIAALSADRFQKRRQRYKPYPDSSVRQERRPVTPSQNSPTIRVLPRAESIPILGDTQDTMMGNK